MISIDWIRFFKRTVSVILVFAAFILCAAVGHTSVKFDTSVKPEIKMDDRSPSTVLNEKANGNKRELWDFKKSQ
jgi:predicted RND superfamily exporter protein